MQHVSDVFISIQRPNWFSLILQDLQALVSYMVFPVLVKLMVTCDPLKSNASQSLPVFHLRNFYTEQTLVLVRMQSLTL